MRLALAILWVASSMVACGGSSQQDVDAPSAARGLPRTGYSRVDRMIARAESQGLGMARVVMGLEAVPMVSVPPPMDPASAEGAPLVEDGSLKGLGFFEVRATSTASFGRSDDPFVLRGTCVAPRRLLALRGEGPVVESARDGHLTYLLVDAVYDTGACGTRGGPRRTVVGARELIPNLLYAFRFVDAREPGIELLSVVMPTAAITSSRSRAVERTDDLHGDFSRVTLPVRPGGSESLLARIAAKDAASWVQKLAPGEPAPVADLLLGVELSHAGQGDTHQLLVYAQRIRELVEQPVDDCVSGAVLDPC